MCGLVGFIAKKEKALNESLFKKMINQLMHRGPDDCGLWSNSGVSLGHRRLSIHDLSSSGKQPMFSRSHKWIVVFNGEIYNYKVMRSELIREKNIDFSSDSDTEVLVNAIDFWGFESALNRFVGMFAIAAYNIEERKLYLARDRFGEKPLYYGHQNGEFAFSSELKPLQYLKEIGWKFTINKKSLALYLKHGYVPNPYSIYNDIKKLAPASYLILDKNGDIKVKKYWLAAGFYRQEKLDISYLESKEKLKNLLKESVSLQTSSDVPLGAFLSGGIDSTLIVALMQESEKNKIDTFSLGFYNKAYDEAVHAKKIASYLGTNHHEIYIDNNDALNVLSSLPFIYDEPFADSSQIPTLLLSRFSKSKVSVALTGDGADELFGGYERYKYANLIKSKILDRKIIRSVFSSIPNRIFDLQRLVPDRFQSITSKISRLNRIVRNSGDCHRELYNQITSIHDGSLLKNGSSNQVVKYENNNEDSSNFFEYMMFTDLENYLTNDILTKVDRASMSASLETRCPFLDQRIYEFTSKLPIEYKINERKRKRILHDILYDYVPRKLVDRPKAGFKIPLKKWLREDIRDWAEPLLDKSMLEEQGLFERDKVRQLWNQHLSGKYDHHAILWSILTFQSWFNRFGP